MEQLAEVRKVASGRRSALALFLFVMAFFVEAAFGESLSDALGIDYDLAYVIAGSVAAVCFVALLGGKGLLRPDAASVRRMLRLGWWLLLVGAAMGAMDLLDFLSSGETPDPSWAAKLVGVALLCLFIGIEEEAMFRGLLLHGILARSGRTRRGVILACVASSLLFGLAHVSELDASDPVQLLQAALKVAQTGTYGFVLAAATLSGRPDEPDSIFAGALFHGLDDFLAMFVSIGLMGESSEVSYVATGADAWPTVTLYAVLTILYLPSVVRAAFWLRALDVPQLGGIARREGQPAPPPVPDGACVGPVMEPSGAAPGLGATDASGAEGRDAGVSGAEGRDAGAGGAEGRDANLGGGPGAVGRPPRPW